MALNCKEWEVLNALADGMQPIEGIYEWIAHFSPDLLIDPRHLPDVLYSLFKRRYVTIMQKPISAFGQEFSTRTITPYKPKDVLGDLAGEFIRFCSEKTYLRFESIPTGSEPAGVPFGIYAEQTELGRVEWDKETYSEYWKEENTEQGS